MKEATHQFWWFVLSCSPRRGRGEHVELFGKLEGMVLKQRQCLGLRDIERRLSVPLKASPVSLT
jgi:hypothetical protein